MTPPDTPAPTLADLIAEGAMDAELAALLWTLAEAAVPVVVCGTADPGLRDRLVGALAGARSASGAPAVEPVQVDVAAWPAALSARILALRPGETLWITAAAPSFQSLLEGVTHASTGLTDDEARALGLTIVLDERGRVEAAHLLRPVERDAQGHLQRRPPAVLAARDHASGRLDHFAWGIGPELADRVDRSDRDLARRLADREALLERLVANGIGGPEAERRMAEHVAGEPPREPAPERPKARDPWPQVTHEPHVH